ncbi:MAG: hypothetical protein L0Z53_05500 [Acidobacteriales bacterium]|nr:hypothetical protein [Terriglobales bacterium]
MSQISEMGEIGDMGDRSVLDNVSITPEPPRISGELLFRLQAAYWKAQTATNELRNSERFYSQSISELSRLMQEAGRSLGIELGRTHDFDITTGEVFEIRR